MRNDHHTGSIRLSTKITLIACACFLALTALILLFLMLFPIQREEITRQLQVSTQPVETVPVIQTQPLDPLNTEGPHTLSGWSASISGYNRTFEEFEAGDEDEMSSEPTEWDPTVTTRVTTREDDTPDDTRFVSTDLPQTHTETVTPDTPDEPDEPDEPDIEPPPMPTQSPVQDSEPDFEPSPDEDVD